MRWTGEYEEDFDNRASHSDDDGDYRHNDNDLYHNDHNDDDHINCEQTQERGDASP